MKDLRAFGLKRSSPSGRTVFSFLILALLAVCSLTSCSNDSSDQPEPQAPPQTQMPAKPQITTLNCFWRGESYGFIESTAANDVYDLLLTHTFKPVGEKGLRSYAWGIEVVFNNEKGDRVAQCGISRTPAIYLQLEGKWYFAAMSPNELANLKAMLDGAPSNKTIPKDMLIGDFSGEGDLVFYYGKSSYKITLGDIKAFTVFPKLTRIKGEEGKWKREGIVIPIRNKTFIEFLSDGDSLIINWRAKYYSAGKGSLARFLERANSIANSRKEVELKRPPKEDDGG